MTQTDLQTQIEAFLLTEDRWFSVAEICERFRFPERLLRADGRRRPLCGRFAISSSTKGLKHISFATVPERLDYKHARRKVLVANARALKEYALAVNNCLTGRKPTLQERHTGQLVFL